MSLFNKGGPKKTGPGPVITRVTVKKPLPPKPAAPAVPSYKSSNSSKSKSSVLPSSSSSKSKSNGHSSSRPSVKGKEKAKDTSRPPVATGNGATLAPARPQKVPTLKRKISGFSKVESESESDEEDAIDLLSNAKRPRTNGSSTPLFGTGDERIGRNRKLFTVPVDGDGAGSSGWEGFVPGEDVIRGVRKGWTEGDGEESRPKSLLDKHVACEL